MRIVRACLLTAVAVAAVLAFVPKIAGAQTGSISGGVRDAAGKPVAYANIWIVGTSVGAMSDKGGHYEIPRVVAGRCTVRVAHNSFLRIAREVLVRVGATSNADFTLEPAPKRPVEKTVRVERERPLVELDEHRVVGVVTPDQIETELGRYKDVLPTVVSSGLEIGVRCVVETSGDSTVVRVIGHVTNLLEREVDICGALSFIEQPYGVAPITFLHHAPIGGWRKQDFPRLEGVGRERTSPTMDCEPIMLGPDESVADTLQFSYAPKTFDDWAGEVTLWCVFFRGNRGEPWEDTEHVDLGTLVIPIR